MPETRAHADDAVFNITGAQTGLSEEQVSRTRKYLISMGIRTGCVLAAIFVPGWPKWLFIVGAVVLPYFAVVIANAGRKRDAPGDLGVEHAPRPSLPSSGAPVLEGTVISPDVRRPSNSAE